jgi:hypothetical protein
MTKLAFVAVVAAAADVVMLMSQRLRRLSKFDIRLHETQSIHPLPIYDSLPGSSTSSLPVLSC